VAAAFNISSIPTLMIVRDSIVLYAQPGALPESALEQLIAKAKELDMDEVRASIPAPQAPEDIAQQAPEDTVAAEDTAPAKA
jgi:thioredoxin 1